MSREWRSVQLIYNNRNRLRELVEKIITDREAVSCIDGHWILTQRHCKKEAVALVVTTAAFVLTFLFKVLVSVFLFPNQYRVPFDFIIVGLPKSYPFVAWFINYAHQLFWIFFLYLCYLLKSYMAMIFMNHSCWLIDSTLVFIDEHEESLIQDDESSSVASVTENLRKINDMVETIVDWQRKGCNLLALNFFGIFMLQCTANCLLFFLFSTNSTNSYAIYGLLLMLNEIFFYCYMGSRVLRRMEKLTAKLYCLGWDRLKPRQRKDLSLILLMSQNLQTYHGVFAPVSFETFQAVRCENISAGSKKQLF